MSLTLLSFYKSRSYKLSNVKIYFIGSIPSNIVQIFSSFYCYAKIVLDCTLSINIYNYLARFYHEGIWSYDYSK